jgi:agmatinase
MVEACLIPVAKGGDHSITLPELRAIAKTHGPVALIHFDS